MPNGRRARGYQERGPAMVRIRRSALEAAHADARARAPEEACGLLIGRDERDGRNVTAAIPIENAWGQGSGSRYLIPAAEVLRVETSVGRDGLTVVGAYHAHPDGSAEPSVLDRENAWPWYTYLIVPGGGGGHARAWRLVEDRSAFREEELVMTEEE